MVFLLFPMPFNSSSISIPRVFLLLHQAASAAFQVVSRLRACYTVDIPRTFEALQFVALFFSVRIFSLHIACFLLFLLLPSDAFPFFPPSGELHCGALACLRFTGPITLLSDVFFFCLLLSVCVLSACMCVCPALPPEYVCYVCSCCWVRTPNLCRSFARPRSSPSAGESTHTTSADTRSASR